MPGKDGGWMCAFTQMFGSLEPDHLTLETAKPSVISAEPPNSGDGQARRHFAQQGIPMPKREEWIQNEMRKLNCPVRSSSPTRASGKSSPVTSRSPATSPKEEQGPSSHNYSPPWMKMRKPIYMENKEIDKHCDGHTVKMRHALEHIEHMKHAHE